MHFVQAVNKVLETGEPYTGEDNTGRIIKLMKGATPEDETIIFCIDGYRFDLPLNDLKFKQGHYPPRKKELFTGE